jgi:hypothetical protein
MEYLAEVQQISSPVIEQEEEYILQMLRESDAAHREQVVLAFMEEELLLSSGTFSTYNNTATPPPATDDDAQNDNNNDDDNNTEEFDLNSMLEERAGISVHEAYNLITTFRIHRLNTPVGASSSSSSSLLHGFVDTTSPSSEEDEELEDGERELCCICFEKAANCKLKPCNHENFCIDCVEKLVEQSRKSKCPMCRSNFFYHRMQDYVVDSDDEAADFWEGASTDEEWFQVLMDDFELDHEELRAFVNAQVAMHAKKKS